MKYYFALIILLLLPLTHCLSQQKIGLEAGLISSNYAGSTNNYSGKSVIGMKAGFIFSFKLSDQVGLRTALWYERNGYTQTFANGKKTVTVRTVEIPFYFQFPLSKYSGYGMSFGIGPYLARNLSADIKYETATSYYPSTGSNYPLYPTTTTIGDGINRIDMGLGANFLYEFKFGLYIRAHGQIGLKGISNSNIINNRQFGFGIGHMINVSPPTKHKTKYSHSKHNSGKSNKGSGRKEDK